MRTVRAFGVTPLPATTTVQQSLQPLYAKSKEEDLELTRQVIREYMEKSDDTTTVAATSEPAVVASSATDDNWIWYTIHGGWGASGYAAVAIVVSSV